MADDEGLSVGGTLTPAENNPFAPQADPFAPVESLEPDWGLVAERVDRARYSACLSLTAMAAQGPRLMGPRSKFLESPLPYAAAYVKLTERILKLLNKYCGGREEQEQ